MTVYLVEILLIGVLGSAIHPRRDQRNRLWFIWLSFLILLFISGMRAPTVGTDTPSYVLLFHNTNYAYLIGSRFEIGFLLYLRILHRIWSSTRFFLFTNSAICIGLVCRFIYKHSEEPCLAVLLYILLKAYFFQMTGLRQALAITFVMTAFSCLLTERNRKNYFISALLMLLAVSFHTASATALIPYVIWIWPNQRLIRNIEPVNTLLWAIAVSAVIYAAYPFVVLFVEKSLPKYSSYFSGTWSDANYFASLFNVLIHLSFLGIGVVFITGKQELSEADRLSLLMAMLTVIVGTLSMRMEIWGRLTGVFSIYTMLLWAPSFTSAPMKGSSCVILKAGMLIFSLAYMIVTFVFRPEWDCVVPYVFLK